MPSISIIRKRRYQADLMEGESSPSRDLPPALRDSVQCIGQAQPALQGSDGQRQELPLSPVWFYTVGRSPACQHAKADIQQLHGAICSLCDRHQAAVSMPHPLEDTCFLYRWCGIDYRRSLAIGN